MKNEKSRKKNRDQVFWEEFVVKNNIKKKIQLTLLQKQVV